MAKIIGTDANDSLTGTADVDQIYGLGGDDRLEAVGVGDTLIGGAGSDTFVLTEDWQDVTLDYADSDVAIERAYLYRDGTTYVLDGAGDIDRSDVQADFANISITGTRYDDAFSGHWEMVEGGAGADQFDLTSGAVTYAHSPQAVHLDFDAGLFDGGDADGDVFLSVRGLTVHGSSYDDHLVGASGLYNDVYLHGGGGDDLLEARGDGGALYGDAGNDTMLGTSGNDYFNGGPGRDVMVGGDGQDRIDYRDASSGVYLNLATSQVSGAEADGDVFSSIEDIYGSSFEDVLIGSDTNNDIDGYAGDDLIIGGDGNDQLAGDGYYGPAPVSVTISDDTILGGDGKDLLNGGAGNDILLGGEDDDWIEGGVGADVLDGGDGENWLVYQKTLSTGSEGVYANIETDVVYGGDAQGDVISNFTHIIGSAEDDFLIGNQDRNEIYGGFGDDVISGGGGHDFLIGAYGADTIEGGDGNDYLLGGTEGRHDGGGANTFVWNEYEDGPERDRIGDFQVGRYGDRIALGSEFQDKSGIHDAGDLLIHAEQTEDGVYIDFSNGRGHTYGVVLDGVEKSDLDSSNFYFADDDVLG